MDKVIYYLASVVAIIFVFAPHEFAHAFVAYKNGDATAKLRGRMSLNPLRHIDPVGLILFAFAGFGWAKPVPIDPYNFRKYKIGMFTTAVAGVVVNYIIAFFAYLIFVLIVNFLFPLATGTFGTYAVYFLFTTFSLICTYSLHSVVFNLLPLYPLDGFRVVEACTRQINPVQRFLRNYGQVILIVLIVESFLCNIVAEYVPNAEVARIVGYLDILGYVSWFAQNIIGFPIKAAWDWIYKL